MWCAFPTHENPAQPGLPHLIYALIVSDATATAAGSVLVAYTTSQPWPQDVALPLGVFRFDRREAAALGQNRAFVLDARRLAYVPVTSRWFPHLDLPDHGIQGHAPKQTQRRIWQAAEELLTRHAELVERLGPLWPGGRR